MKLSNIFSVIDTNESLKIKVVYSASDMEWCVFTNDDVTHEELGIGTYWHTNDFYLVVWLVDGELSIMNKDRRIGVEKNSIVCVAPNELIKWDSLFKPLLYGFVIPVNTYRTLDCCTSTMCDQTLFRDVCVIQGINLRVRKQLYFLLEEMFDENKNKSVQFALLVLFLSSLLSLYQSDRMKRRVENIMMCPDGSFTMSSYHDVFNRFLYEIERNQNKYKSIDMYAKMLGVTRKQLYSVVNENTCGKTPCDIIKMQKMNKAKFMLEKGISIKEITYKLGYSSPSHFSSCFKKIVGMSPSSFMKLLGKRIFDLPK